MLLDILMLFRLCSLYARTSQNMQDYFVDMTGTAYLRYVVLDIMPPKLQRGSVQRPWQIDISMVPSKSEFAIRRSLQMLHFEDYPFESSYIGMTYPDISLSFFGKFICQEFAAIFLLGCASGRSKLPVYSNKSAGFDQTNFRNKTWGV